MMDTFIREQSVPNSNDQLSPARSVDRENSTKKICLVCGDKALGYNFNAITCESCKAFFRRNALKQKVFKCPFRDQCEITVLSRRFCQKCRLRKCLEVGMLTDLIMTTRTGTSGDAITKADGKLRKRRRHRDPINNHTNAYEFPSNHGVDSVQYPCEISPIYHQYNNQYGSDLEKWHSNGQFYSNEPTPIMPTILPEYFFDYEMKKEPHEFSFECKKELPFYYNESASHDQNVPIGQEDARKGSLFTCTPDSVHGSSNCSDDNWILCPLNATQSRKSMESGDTDEWAPIAVDLSCGLGAWKLFRLEELLSANEIMAVPNRGPPISFADDTLAEHMGEVCIRRCVQLARRIQAFRNLLACDQITLLKDAAAELMLLRGLMVYQPQVDSWRPIGFPHRYLRLGCTINNDKLRKFYNEFPNEWRTNDPIMLCLSSIILFDPNRPNLHDKQAVRLQQQFYFDLLKDYLKSVYPDGDNIYWRICELLTLLRRTSTRSMPLLGVEMDSQNLEVTSVIFDWRFYGSMDENETNRSGVTISPLDD